MKQYDAVIIGFGKGGKTLAIELANHEWNVAIIERSDKMFGGTCPNIGCIPTKFLIHRAKIDGYNEFRTNIEKESDYKEAIKQKNELTASLRKNNYKKLADQENITIYNGEASFKSSNIISIKTAKENIEISGKKIFINTGSESIIPPINGIKDSKYIYTSKTIMELTELPKRLIVIGGGYIGLEFASMYAEFGSKVTVLESGSILIPREDRDIADCVKEILERKGVTFKMNAKVQSVYDTANGVTVTYKDTADEMPYFVEGDAVLLATGRKAYTEGLNLGAIGIQTDTRGNIIVDEHLHTTVPNVYALGDVKGGLQFTYISLDDYRIIRDDLFGDKKYTTDRGPVPYSVFIDPPLSRVGLSEEEALMKDLNIKVISLPASASQRLKTLEETSGLLKAIIDSNTNKIIGCTLLCADSSEVINLVTMAMKTNQDYTFLRDFIFTHPSVSEILNELFDFK